MLDHITPQKLKALTLDGLKAFADEVRQFLITSTAETGGHIGANLGVVELSIALHKVFDSPKDKLVWDTGHQGYVHKLITGRKHLFPTLNTYGGMNRFVTRTESEHDIIEASHAGTSISIALGIALARMQKGEQGYTIAVIGDGALCEGLALEALNHAAVEQGTQLVVVLNDNGYSISPGFGGLHNYLQSLHPGTSKTETLFSSLGLEYIGPVDGHSLDELLPALERARQAGRVPFVHVKTEKGKGLPPAGAHPYKMHFSFPFDPATGKQTGAAPQPGYQDIAARVIGEEMEQDKKIVCITPSTLYATGLQPIFNRYPERCFDPGMEEQHALTMTVGFALEGQKPVAFYQSTFLQRAFDQLLHDVCFMNLPTLILAVRSGFAGYDNPTHHGIYDFSYLRGLPNLRVLYPKDSFELERMVRDNLRDLQGPTVIAMPYGPAEKFDESVLNESPASFGQAQVAAEGDPLIIAVGNKASVAHSVASTLRERGVQAGLVNLRYLKPLPEAQLVALMKKSARIVTLEEHVLDGGVGSAIAALAADHTLQCDILRIGIKGSVFVEPGSNQELSAAYGLDEKGVLRQIEARWRI